MQIGTMAASTTTVLPLTYLPAEIYFIAATVPTGLKVNVLGEGVVMDLDGNGITSLNNLRGVSRVTNSYKLALADGLIENRNVEIAFTNAVAGSVSLYGYSMQKKGSIYIQSIRQSLLANSGAKFTDFAVLTLPAIGATDSVDIEFADGLTQRFSREELLALNMASQNNVGSYVIDNLDGYIKAVTVIPAATQTAYLMRYAATKNVNPAVFDS